MPIWHSLYMDFPNTPVFPAGPNKAPLTAHGFKDATTNPEQIAEWWERWPDALIAVPTGKTSGILVIDIDPEALAWYKRQNWECGRIHRTRRGVHLLYKMPEQAIGCSSALFPKGVDVRADGGYIIWWPSHGGTVTGDELVSPPEWVMNRLTAPKDPRSSRPLSTDKAIRIHAEHEGVGVFSCW